MRHAVHSVLFVVTASAVLLTGCATAAGGARGCVKTDPVEITIDASGTKPATVPERVDVCHGKQSVVWIARGAKDLDIVLVRKAKTNPPPGNMGSLRSWDVPCTISTDGTEFRCVLEKGKHNGAGWLAYDVELVDALCNRQEIDPYLIIKR